MSGRVWWTSAARARGRGGRRMLDVVAGYRSRGGGIAYRSARASLLALETASCELGRD